MLEKQWFRLKTPSSIQVTHKYPEVVLGVGVEPTCLSTGDFKSPVYTISPPERCRYYNLNSKINK